MQADHIKQESEALGNLLVWSLEDQNQLIQYQLHLLIRKRPAYLLPGFLRYRSGKPQFCLETTGFLPLDQVLQGDLLTPDRGKSLLADLVEILIDAVDHLLPIHQFTLNPALIFMQPDQTLRLAFWPIRMDPLENNNRNAYPKDLGELPRFLQIIGSSFKIPHDKIELYQQVLQNDDLQKLHHQLTHQSDHDEIKPLSQPSHRLKIPRTKKYNRRQKKEWLKDFCEKLNQLFEKLGGWLLGRDNQILAEAEDQTVLLAENPADFRMAHLSEGMPGTPEENEGLRAYVLVDDFIIGRDQKTSDLCLNYPGIGRQHARISRRAGSFFLCDLGSRNGTSLDGRRLLKNTENLLPDQCLLGFADRSFYFQAD